MKAAIYDLIDGGSIRSDIDTRRHVLNVAKGGALEVAEAAFSSLTHTFRAVPKVGKDGRKRFEIPNVGPSGESLSVAYYPIRTGQGPTVLPHVGLPDELAFELGMGNFNKVQFKVRFEER